LSALQPHCCQSERGFSYSHLALCDASNANLTAHDQNAAIGEQNAGWVPALALFRATSATDILRESIFSYLEMHFLEVLLPIICPIDTCRPVRRVQPAAYEYLSGGKGRNSYRMPFAESNDQPPTLITRAALSGRIIAATLNFRHLPSCHRLLAYRNRRRRS
jgi:hypothetical protein